MSDTEERPSDVEGEEDEEEMRRRHNKETRALEGQTRAMLKKAPKPKKAQVEAEVAKLEADLKVRHEKELARFASKPGGGGDDGGGGKGVRFAPSTEAGGGGGGKDGGGESEGEDGEEEEDEAARIARKREKALRKKNKKAQKELEREAEVEKAKEGIVNPRDVEMEALERALGPLGYRVLEVNADGHCLYRAVAHQLGRLQKPDANAGDYSDMRRLAAAYLRAHPDDFLPFMDVPPGETDMQAFFDRYCRTVEGTAEWGGELELRALCHALEAPITVYSAEAPPLQMGQGEYGDRSPPLRLAFHRHYYALGEHYNSVVPTGGGAAAAEEEGEGGGDSA